MREKQMIWKRIIPASLLLLCVFAGFASYININRKMTVSRNARYVEDAANQTANRIEDLLVGAENSISAIAHLYGQTMNPDRIDIEILQKMVDDTPFDYIGIVNADGIYTDNRGKQAQVSDRFYFQDGMAGNTGMDIIFNGRIAQENLMIFYAPLWSDGQIAGVLTGRYGENQMRQIIATTFFEESAMTYLCLPDGTVFSSSDESIEQENILTALQRADGVDKETLAVLEDALASGRSQSLTYTSKQGSNAAYVTKLPGKDWMLLQVFPIKVTNAMLSESNAVAMYLELWLVLLFVVYILILLWENWRQKAKLVMEKQEMRDIVERTSLLFSRFVLVDLKNDTYEYLKTDTGEVSEADGVALREASPQKGIYSQLRDFWDSRVVAEDAPVRNQLTGRAIQENLTEDTTYLQYEYRVMEDRIRWTQISVLCLKREKGVPVSVLMAVQDVTELKEREQRSRVALEDAYQSAQAANEAKRTFLFDMSHDMRTPLNAVIGLAGLLDRDAAEPDRVRSYSRKIRASGQHLLTLVNEVLDMSKIESGRTSLNLSVFSLSELLEGLTFVFQPQAQEKGQSLKINAFGVPQERLIGDKLRLNEILGNLLSNAIKYTGQGGEVNLTVHGLAQTTPGYVHLLFEVTDNGIGMSPEYLPHVFDPFTREKNSTVSGIQGAGLGLTITKSIVDLMGGTIRVDSVPGKGSTFQVELELRPAVEDGDSAFWKEQGIHKALILGSDEKICQSIHGLMAETGVELQYTTDSPTAWKLAENAAFDLILLDHTLPGMDAMEAIGSIRSHYGNAPTLILIDGHWIGKEKDARGAGANGFLPAPFSMATLKKVVSECRCQPQADRTGVSLEGLRMLVAEDNDINAEILMELLDLEGIQSVRAENGCGALEEFRSKPEGYYDGVLMDIQMPEMNGYEAAQAIRAMDRPDAKTIPIVAMTANAFAEDVQKSMEAGMNAHLAKPVDMAALKDVLAKLLRAKG